MLEILLKAKLLSAYPQIGNKRQRDIPEADRDIWNLIWRSHDLTEMLNRLPQLEAAVRKSGERSGKPVEHYLKQVCATWTIHARYSPQSATIADAREMLSRVRILKEVLK